MYNNRNRTHHASGFSCATRWDFLFMECFMYQYPKQILTHDGEVPVWAIVEVLSFDTLSKIIKNLKTGTGSSYSVLAANYQYKSQKGNLVNLSKKMFTSWIQGVSILRNMCAHNSRIYNRTIHTTPEILDVDKITPMPVHNGLYQILLAMKYLRSSEEEWKEFVYEFDKLIQKIIA